ncbi:MAG: cell division protein FtsA, partial [Clostridia bacterium]
MAIGDVIVGIDIGTSKVSTVIGEVNNFNQVEIIATAECKCFGMKKSKITDEEEVASAIAKTIAEVEQVANLSINSAYVTILGKYVTIVQNSIVKEPKDKFAGISSKDVNSAITQLKDIDIPEDKVVIDMVVSEFALDNGRIVEDPVGMLSSSFTVKGQVVLADKEYVRKLTNIFKKVNIEIDGIIPNVLAERKLILDKNELKDNVMILDIGAGNTDIGVFNEESIIYTNTIPLGGDTITSDIAMVFNISEEEADRLKKQYGLALRSFIDNDTDIMLN